MAARVEQRRVRAHPAVAPRPASPRSRTSWLLLGLVAALDVIGLVMVLSASSVNALRVYGSAWIFFSIPSRTERLKRRRFGLPRLPDSGAGAGGATGGWNPG